MFVLLPHIILCLLKYPIKINGLGSRSIRLFNSFSFMGSWGGIYSEQMVTVLCRVAETVIVIYEALYFDVAQGRLNGAPNETRTHSCRFASQSC